MPVIGVGLVLKAGMPARGFEIARVVLERAGG